MLNAQRVAAQKLVVFMGRDRSEMAGRRKEKKTIRGPDSRIRCESNASLPMPTFTSDDHLPEITGLSCDDEPHSPAISERWYKTGSMTAKNTKNAKTEQSSRGLPSALRVLRALHGHTIFYKVGISSAMPGSPAHLAALESIPEVGKEPRMNTEGNG